MTAPRADLDELGRLLAEAAPGPWEWGWLDNRPGGRETYAVTAPYRIVAETNREQPGHSDAALIAALVNAAPALLAEVAELRETVARVKATRKAWLEVHGDEANDLESLGLYGVAYREAAADTLAALATPTTTEDHR